MALRAVVKAGLVHQDLRLTVIEKPESAAENCRTLARSIGEGQAGSEIMVVVHVGLPFITQAERQGDGRANLHFILKKGEVLILSEGGTRVSDVHGKQFRLPGGVGIEAGKSERASKVR